MYLIKYIYPLSKVYIVGRISKLIHPHVANATGGEYDVTDIHSGCKRNMSVLFYFSLPL
jgi:hypothetical protein